MRPSPFALERFFAEHEFTAPYLLCCSDCESVRVEELTSAAPDGLQGLLNLQLRYGDSHGEPALREAIAKLYETIEARNVLVFTGAEEAIFAFVHSMLDQGDHVITTTPAYQSLAELPRAGGCRVTGWPLLPQNGFAPDPDLPAREADASTRAIIVNFPHNPTGYLPSREFFANLAAFCAERSIILFSDEVYRYLEYDPATRLPAACDLSDTAVSLGVLSKSFGLPGLRVGWVATRNQQVLEAMAAMKDYLSICGSRPSEYLACLALHDPEKLVARNRRIVLENMSLLNGFFKRREDLFSWIRPAAGPLAFPEVVSPRLGGGAPPDAAVFAQRLLEETGVLVAPGALFGMPGPHFRVGFGRMDMRPALARLEAWVETVVPAS
ncbi:hypothetical protein DPQ33_01725 [Oceanidesulfovibrio indonesiensis]|uniref:Aminotransferase class I/classII large domain-containing protein n=1 Tax=Oceanidesulfovibrio indonesiensis TaxID=54767 RepID=A0A7M3MJW5_9BACT|nr:aminotransferase class I/II-fold pyridoxal phosphate-dependent enzyme [Oceanidesulfovibrio indonesiensis]TVM19970.1 hypothetical protein DPQ33_01725 [Oceanidesulfovibrio indonesiensis]